MEIMLSVFVTAVDGTDPAKLAEHLFDYLCDDPNDNFPEITSVNDYN
ncbi:hypothetical protein IAI43_12260, partial [Streptococcus pseudopneumoniae]|nr:hypothetical protein [Streptococcus pseudopneumoniae]